MTEIAAYTGVKYHQNALLALWERVKVHPNDVMARTFNSLIHCHNEGCRTPLSGIESIMTSALRNKERERTRVIEDEWAQEKQEERSARIPPEIKKRLVDILGAWG